MKCNNHTTTTADGVCVECGHLFCRDCLIEIGERYYCKSHAAQQVSHHRKSASSANSANDQNTNPRDVGAHVKWLISLLLCIFLGMFGVHRFYLGRIGTGFLWLFTGGLLGIGWFVDIILIAAGQLD